MPAIAVLSAARTTPSGAYLNAGDELLTRRLVGWLRRELPDARIVRSLGGRTAPRDGGDLVADATIDPRELVTTWQAIRRSDVVLIGGGTLLQADAPPGRVPAGMVRYVATVSAMCRLAGVHHAFAGVGVELPEHRRDRALLVAAARGADRCLVRDAESAEALAGEGVASSVVGDAYLLPPRAASVGTAPDERTTGLIAPRADLTAADAEEVGRRLAAHPEVAHWTVVAMHRDPGGVDDLRAVDLLGPVLEGRSWSTLDATERPGELPALAAAAATCIAMRLHAAYVAIDASTPVELVGTAAKVRRLAGQLAEDPTGGVAWASDASQRLDAALRGELDALLAPARRPRTTPLGAAT